MIIQNNFNSKDANHLKDYQGIGKGSHSLDKKFELEKEGFIRENLNNKVIQDVLSKDTEYDTGEEKENDKWDFFR